MDQIAQPSLPTLKQALDRLYKDDQSSNAVIVDVSALHRACKALIPDHLGGYTHERVLCSIGDCDALYSIIEDIDEVKEEVTKLGIVDPIETVNTHELYDTFLDIGESLGNLVKQALKQTNVRFCDIGSVYLTKESRLVIGIDKA